MRPCLRNRHGRKFDTHGVRAGRHRRCLANGLEAEGNERLAQQYEILARKLADIPPGHQAGFTPCCRDLAAQSRQDVIGLADLLEYELLPQLRILQLLAETTQ
jgi:hypothetical protein